MGLIAGPDAAFGVGAAGRVEVAHPVGFLGAHTFAPEGKTGEEIYCHVRGVGLKSTHAGGRGFESLPLHNFYSNFFKKISDF